MPGGNNRTHGMYNTKFYFAWSAMKARCKIDRCADRYRDRGISVCLEWQTFEGFKRDMFATYREGLSLERLDNDKGYNKNNCAWVTMKEQSRNRGSNVFVETSQGRMVVADAAKIAGVSWQAIRARIQRGWGPDRILAPCEIPR